MTSITSTPKSKSINPHIRKNQDAARKVLGKLTALLDVPTSDNRECSISSISIKKITPREVEIS